MYEIAEAAEPITGRGVGYKLFTRNMIPDMSRKSMRQVYRLLTIAREEGIIPWEWIVDETRSLEKVSSWKDPEEFLRCARRSYRRDAWHDQPRDIEVWSEKGTVRGVLQPVLDEYGVGFRVMHGFSGASTINEVATENRDKELIILYVGDYDPSGLYMSDCDIPDRLERYGGDCVLVRLDREALLQHQLTDLPSFEAEEKKDDPRYRWFVENYGNECWELDAMDPNDLRECVEDAISYHLDRDAWDRHVIANEAEQESLKLFFDSWQNGTGSKKR